MKKLIIFISFGLLLASCTQVNNEIKTGTGIKDKEITNTKNDAGYCSEYPDDYKGQCKTDSKMSEKQINNIVDEAKKHTSLETNLTNSGKIKKITTTLNNNTQEMPKSYQTALPKDGDIVAIMKTTNGVIKIKLFTNDVPTVANNFIGLANEGYYDGIIFHRVINNFMIQGGDPTGTGRGGKSIYGENFDDEFSDKLTNMIGSISMANSGENTNGSQFFINQKNNSNLDFNKQPFSSKHAVFGQVYEGMENVNKIAKTKVGEGNKPVKDIKIISLTIFKLEGTKEVEYKIDKEEIVKLYNSKGKIKEEKIKKENKAKKTKKIEIGDKISVNYTGKLEDGTIFDSSLTPGRTPIEFEVGAKQMIKGFDEGVVGMIIGDKKTLTLKPTDAYGEYNEKNIQEIPIEQLKSFEDAGIKLEVGTELPTQMGKLKIKEIKGDIIVIDANHELAGKTLIFEVEIIDIK